MQISAKKKSVLIGDFNLPDIDWGTGLGQGRAADVVRAVEDSLMVQLVDFPTQVRGNTLDLVLTNMYTRAFWYN